MVIEIPAPRSDLYIRNRSSILFETSIALRVVLNQKSSNPSASTFALTAPKSGQRNIERCVTESGISGFPRPGHAIDIDDLVIGAADDRRKGLKVSLQHTMLDLGLLTVMIEIVIHIEIVIKASGA
jgi:hypothetical protein